MLQMPAMLLSVACVVLLVRVVRKPFETLSVRTHAVLTLLLVAQLLVEGPLLRMLPAYAVIIVAEAITLARALGRSTPGLIGQMSGSGILSFSVLAQLAAPSATSAAAPGPFQVSLQPLSMTLNGEVPGGFEPGCPVNGPFVRLWYPVIDVDPAGTSVVATYWSSWRARLRAQSQMVAPPSGRDGRYRLLLVFPGWEGTQVDNLSLVRHLVSRGFVVASFEYPKARRECGDAENADTAGMDFSSAARTARTLELADARVRSRATDAVRLLDRLATLRFENIGASFTQLLNLESVGIAGFSLGGAVAAEASVIDPRFSAAVNIDGLHFADAAEQGVAAAYLLISDDTPLPSMADLNASDPERRNSAWVVAQDARRSRDSIQRHGGTFMSIAGTRHLNFTDSALHLWPWQRSAVGSIAPHRALQILDDYVAAFFESRLEGKPSLLLQAASSTYPEVSLQRIAPRQSAQTAANPGKPDRLELASR